MRRSILAIVIAFSFGASSLVASAQQATDPLQDTVERLAEQGFEVTRIRRTWLGRIKIEAESDRHEREVVLSPNSGLILRDFWEERDDDDDDDHDDNEDDDDWDDEDEDDEDEEDWDDEEDEEDEDDDDEEDDENDDDADDDEDDDDDDEDDDDGDDGE